MRDFHAPGRSAVLGERGMVATSHSEASIAALDVLREGGNAVDAALAAAAVLTVVEPAMTGIGGDCFVLYAPAGRDPIALNGSGWAGRAATVDALKAEGLTAIADDSPHAITVPGAIDAWCRLHGDHGRLDLARLMEPAARLAEGGFRVAPRVALDWDFYKAKLARHADTAALLLPGGRPPTLGDSHAQPLLAKRLRAIGAKGRAAFYEGETTAAMVRYLRSIGSLLTEEDFAYYASRYEMPLVADVGPRQVVECPPNGQGLTALALLRILDGWAPYEAATDEITRIHLFGEATKRAYAMRDGLIGDPRVTPVPVDEILSDAWRDRMRASIDPARATPGPELPKPLASDTICLSVVDRDGNVVSFINSIFLAFGSTRYDAETGVLFHCRGMSFNLRDGHPNAIGPRKRPMHTIIPGLVMADGQVALSFGVMGGQYQAAGHAHLLTEYFTRGQDLQSAIDLPRHFAYQDELSLERRFAPEVIEGLGALGHHVVQPVLPQGGAQAIAIDRRRGVLIGASDGRKDGCALGY